MSAQEISAVNRRFEEAARKGDFEAIAALYTGDAIALPPDGPFVRGRDIKQLWKTVINDMRLQDVKLDTTDLDIAGDTACEVGEGKLTLRSADGSPTAATVKYVVVWKKTDGQWRLHRDIWNAKAA